MRINTLGTLMMSALFLAGCGKPEVRNQNTCGEQSESSPKSQIRIVGDNIEVPAPPDGPEPWMIELAKMLILKDLPTGVIVGSASIREVVKGDSPYEWHLTDVERAKRFRKPKGHPQPVWFTPF